MDALRLRGSDLNLAARAAVTPRIKDKRLIYFHAPKCGGVSVGGRLGACFGLVRAITRFGIASLDPGASRKAAGLAGISVHRLREQLLLYHAARGDVRYIYGHFPYSCRLDGFGWDYLTILRSPESRFLSAYYYNAYKSHQAHFGTDLSLEAFLETPRARLGGAMYVSFFEGTPSRAEIDEAAEAERITAPGAIAAAKRNLRKFAIVGALENLAGFERAIGERYRTTVRFPHANRNPAQRYPRFKDLAPAVRLRIEEVCAPDREVFDAAVPASGR